MTQPRPSLAEDGCLRLALPSDRMMEGETLDFLANCGLPVSRPSARQYIGRVASIPGVSALFQRSVDIPGELDEGAVDLAVVGLERYLESCDEAGDTMVLIGDLGYSQARLVVAVPNSWNSVASMKELAAAAGKSAQRGNPLRVATKYHRQVGRFLDRHQVKGYRLVHVTGGVEAAPMMDTADVISDLSSSGGTLRENNLKILDDGVIVESAACLVANKRLLREDQAKKKATKMVLELIEARLRAEGLYTIIANIQGESVEAVAKQVMSNPDVAGMQGPTVSKVVSKTGEDDWYSVSVVTPIARLTSGVDHLRKIGASGVVVSPAHYVFGGECEAYRRLESALAEGGR